ncbi:MAG: molybdopterin molybdenumtransferase MoeA, partial [Campylobacter sp.]|nr:molybdopterin molybdenumtransferase MoeA [Campylobacter sp.]
MPNLPKFEDTIANLKKSVTKWDRVEKIALTQALDRVLATDIIAPHDHPKQPTAAMDGYAVKFSDLKENAEIKILGKTPA